MSDHSIFSSTIPNGQDHSMEVGDSETGIDLSGYFSREELEGDTRNYDVRLRADVNAYAADDGADQADTSLARYRMSRGGLFYYPDSKKNVEDNAETAKPIWLSPPFEVVARTRDPDGNWGKLLWWKDHDGGEVKWVMPARLLGGHRDELWQALYERGLEISSANAARNLLLAYLTRVNRKAAPMSSRVLAGRPRAELMFLSCQTPYMATLAAWKSFTAEMRRAPRIA